MLPDRVSNPGPLTYESGALPIALRGPAPDRRYSGFFKDNFSYFSKKTCDPSLKPSRGDGSNEGSQYMFCLKKKENYPCYPFIFGTLIMANSADLHLNSLLTHSY